MSGTASYATPAPTRSPVMTHHHLHSSPETCHWGFFEAKLKPVLTVASGDEVTVDTISGGPEVVPDKSRFHVPPELAEVHAKNERMVPGHILTGPIAVAGAEPGDVLEVEILDVRLRQDWGYNLIRPLAGTLPDDFHETRLLNIPLDQKRMVGRLPWGLDLPLRPFFGVMGVAPPPTVAAKALRRLTCRRVKPPLRWPEIMLFIYQPIAYSQSTFTAHLPSPQP